MQKSNKVGLNYLIHTTYQRPVHDDKSGAGAGTGSGEGAGAGAGEGASAGTGSGEGAGAGARTREGAGAGAGEGAGAGAGEGAGAGAGSGEGAGAGAGDGKGKTFTQEDVNRILADDKRKLREQNDKLIKDLDALKNSSSMSEAEKSKLASQIEALQTQSMTEKEKAQREKEKIEKDLSKTIETITKERDDWSMRCEKYMKQNELNIAANENDAFNAQQIVQILEPNTKLVENQENGSLEIKVRFDDVDKDDKPVTLELAPKEAVKRMKDLPDRFGNLFKNNATGGLGSMNTSTNGKASVNLKDPAAYRSFPLP